MNREDVSRWLAAYVDAWRSYDRAAIVALFTEAAQYRYYPYEDPIVGADAIADSWLAEPDDPTSWDAAYSPVAVDGDTAVAVGQSRYDETADRPARVYHNCYVLQFADDGRCREFTEWFVQAPLADLNG